VHITLFIVIILCIFIFSFLLFRIYNIEKKTKMKKTKNKITNNKNEKKQKQHLLSAVGLKKPPFQLAVAACQPTTTIAILPPLAARVGPYRQLKWW
jgi:hypothetical protein